MEFPRNYIVFDTETTGLFPEQDKIIELGAIKVIEGQVIARFNCLVNHGVEISAKTIELTTITKELVEKEGISPEKAISNFLEFIGSNLTIVGHNIVRFDIPFVNAWSPGFKAMVDERVIDTAALYKAKKLGVNPPEDGGHHDWALDLLNQKNYGVKYSVSVCCEELGIDKAGMNQHRAMGDVELTNEIYKRLCLGK
jgi:DNA polymerase III epsilon subunit-like protein